jgi:hypothetical protein
MKETTWMEAKKCTMTCNSKELRDTMRFLSVAVPKTAKGKLFNCEITIKTNEVIFVVIGASRTIFCKTVSPVKVSVPFHHLSEVVKNTTTTLTHFEVTEESLTIGNLTMNAKTCFFEDDSILRSIDLPINFSVSDMRRIIKNYTPEEIEFNNLNKLMKKTYDDLAKDITKVRGILKKYGVTLEELYGLLDDMIFYKSLS